jgi:N-acetylmuramoyl-L-alanine amidase
LRFSFRAAAYAAAAMGMFVTAGYAGPSLASETETNPAVSYTDHAATTLSVEALGFDADLLQNVEAGAASGDTDADASAPVAVHALAPALPESMLIEEAPAAERGNRSLAELVADYSASQTPDAETECLARGVYYESKGEPLAGQLTVAEVIINRARSGRFPSTVCGVLRQRGQFSFVRGGHIPQPPAGSRDWRVAVAIAQIAMQDLADGAAPRALFFHARHVRPGWRLTRVATVGNHIFYR